MSNYSQPHKTASCHFCAHAHTPDGKFRYERATGTVEVRGQIYSACDYHQRHTPSNVGMANRNHNDIETPSRSPYGGAMSNGTGTSEESARLSAKDVSPQQAMVITALVFSGKRGMTRAELERELRISNQALCARLRPLEDAGVVYTNREDKRHNADTGRNQKIYRITGVAA